MNKDKLQQIASGYEDSPKIRALIQTIPYIGGSIDVLITSQAPVFRYNRLEKYINSIAEYSRKNPEKIETLINRFPEEVFDLFRSHIEESDRTRDDVKRSMIANIFINQSNITKNWNEPETATRLLRHLTVDHIRLLKAICEAPVCIDPYQGLKVSVISEPRSKETNQFLILEKVFGEIPKEQLRILISELLSLGLIKDEGVGRFGASAMEKFSPLKGGDWFLNWIFVNPEQ